MSEHDGGRGPEARGSGSSLTDAVVAALANVSAAAPAGGSSGSDPEKKDSAPEVKPSQPEAQPAAQVEAKPSQPEVKPSPTVMTGTPEPAAAARTIEVRGEPAQPTEPTEQRAGETTAGETTAGETTAGETTAGETQAAEGAPTEPQPVVEPARDSAAPDSAAPDSAAPDSAAPDSAAPDSAAPDSEAPTLEVTSPSEPGSSEGAPRSEPTLKVGGAPVETLTKEAAGAAEGISVQYYGRTDVGLVREHNEDNYLVADLSAERRGNDGAILKTKLGSRGMVLAVCDGMGGAAAGEVASQMAVDTIHEILQAGGPVKDRDQFARRLVHSIEEAGARIFSAAKMDRTRRGMGTTSTVAGLVDSTLFVGQVGDSRAYVLRGDQFALITKDQSLVNQLIEAGQLTEEEAEAFEHSNIILQALGTTEEVTVDLTFLELRRGDRLLMCSDGLSGLVHADMMREVLKSSRDLSEAAQQLIAMANAGGGHDNITVILAEFDGSVLRETSADARVAYQQYPLPPEDPSQAESTGKSATSIKSGGPKPGADVKSGEPREAGPAESGNSRLWIVAVLVLLLLMGVAAVIVMMDDGEHEGAADDATTRVTIATEVSARAPAPPPPGAPAEGRVVVRTDAEGVLYVNGQRAQAQLAGVAGEGGGEATLSLPPGAYRLEVRNGDIRIADTTVTVESGREERVALTMPTAEMPELGAGDDEALAIGEGMAAAAQPEDTLGSPVARQQAAQQVPPPQQPASPQAGQVPAQQAPAVPGQVL